MGKERSKGSLFNFVSNNSNLFLKRIQTIEGIYVLLMLLKINSSKRKHVELSSKRKAIKSYYRAPHF